MLGKRKVARLIIAVFEVVFVLSVCGFLVFGKKNLGQKMTVNYVTSPKYAIDKCRQDAGYSQKLIGTYDNVSYCMSFPIFDNRKWSNHLFDEINSCLYRYKKDNLSDKLKDDKFELFSNYQVFKCGNVDEHVSVQMQFLEKNLTKKTEIEVVKTYLFSGDKLINEKSFFKNSELTNIVDEIRKAFSKKYSHVNVNVEEMLPYSLKTLHNFVLTENSVIFFYERGKVLPHKFKVASVEVDISAIEKYINIGAVFRQRNCQNQKPMVALTFDDGPHEENTEQLLEILKENNAHATFFVLGKNAKNHPDLLKKMVDYGCEIGNHTFSHANLNRLSERDLQVEIGKTNEIIEEATGGYRSGLIRPPGGACNNKVKNVIDQPIILWSIDTLDWKHKNSGRTIETVLNNVKDGAIILMHDIHHPSIEAAKVLIPKLIEAGFELVTVSELAQSKGEPLGPHNKYFSIQPKIE